MENSRLLTFLVISLAIVILYNQLLQWRHPELAHRRGVVAATATPAPSLTPRQEQAAPAAAASAASASGGTPAGTARAGGAGAITASPARTITINTNLYEAELTLRGGRVASFLLRDYRQTSARDSPPYQIIAGGHTYNLSLTNGTSQYAIVVAAGDYNGDGIVNAAEPPSGRHGRHAMLMVGYTGNYYLVKNSWGEDWGDKGYCQIPKNVLAASDPELVAVLIKKEQPA